MFFKEIRLFNNLNELIKLFGGMEDFYLLDSGSSELPRGRFSYCGLYPDFTVFQKGKRLLLTKSGKSEELEGNIFSFLKKSIQNKKAGPFPFNGGFIGYFTYDYGYYVENFKKIGSKKSEPEILDVKLNYYSEILVYDHLDNKFYYLSENQKSKYLELIKERVGASFKSDDIKSKPTLKSSFTRESYREAILKTKKYISQGDIYQANISQRFSSKPHIILY